MKKFRIVIWAVTGFLAAAVLAGAMVLVLSPDSAFETAFNIIAFSISAASVAIAVMSQVSAYKDRQKIEKLIHGMHELDGEVEEGEQTVEYIRRKLIEIAAQEKEIDKKVSRMERRTRKK